MRPSIEFVSREMMIEGALRRVVDGKSSALRPDGYMQPAKSSSDGFFRAKNGHHF